MNKVLFRTAAGVGLAAAGVALWAWATSGQAVSAPGAPATRHALVDGDDPFGESAAAVAYLDQGWSPADSAEFYSTTQGSRLVPYGWFLALEQEAAAAPFRDLVHVRRFRYLTQKPNPASPDGLPVGFVKDPRREGERVDWLGLTCAACHTAELHYQGTAYRVDGGPAAGDIDGFLTALTRALQSTLETPVKFDRFAEKVLAADDTSARSKDELRAQLEAVCRSRVAYDVLNRPPHAYGFARLDAFGRILNTLLVHDLAVADPAQRKAPDAPVSYPFLWDTPHHDFVQWNAIARNRILGSEAVGGLARNVGEVIGVFGEVHVSPPHTASVFVGYNSSIRVRNLVRLEALVTKLLSPQWPAAFPAIDEPKRAAGAALFGTYCAHCHEGINRSDPDRLVRAVKTPLRDIRTDPRMATNFATRTAKTGLVEGRRAFFVAGDRFGPEAPADQLLTHVVAGVILNSPFNDYRSEDLAKTRERPAAMAAAADDPRLVYKGRPLNGIWATAPYLHNGSVPSLYQLLLPAGGRATQFTVGRRAFDPKGVGFVTDPFPGGFVFRTADAAGQPIPGNSNAGHEYGTGRPAAAGGDGLPALTDDQRWQLVEYLKSL